ncbi:hypothetical protein [Clostridium sp. D53t1_180928_C8]|uniref:hypothetical protein n=1 Tax=Clostridium sp. D53t1_180928_C8 TaxID=2787101 RepID=UPI0018AB6376|nr:hypothetical protein [Clostridium sp. D53t1_180928_C8]
MGEKISLKYVDKNKIEKEIQLEVTGITNSSFQDFIVSSNIEKEIYDNMDLSDKDIIAISFTVKDFAKTPQVEKIIILIIYNTWSWVSGFSSNFI